MLICEYAKKLINNLAILIPIVIFVLSVYGLTLVEGAHQVYFEMIEKQVLWCGYWVGLGKFTSRLTNNGGSGVGTPAVARLLGQTK